MNSQRPCSSASSQSTRSDTLSAVSGGTAQDIRVKPGEAASKIADVAQQTGSQAKRTLAYTFRHVYRFILQAMNGDTVAARAIFERYLAGELSEELLIISRQCVNAHQKRAPNPKVEKARKTGGGVSGAGDAVIVVS